MGGNELSVEESSDSGMKWPITLLIVNAVLGLIAFEWAWYKTRRFRNPILELDTQFPELRRLDAPNWRKWKLYPGALTILIPRLLSAAFWGLAMVLGLNVLLICHDSSKPLVGCRKIMCRVYIKACVHFISIFSFFTILGHKEMALGDVNYYEEYLGPVQDQKRY